MNNCALQGLAIMLKIDEQFFFQRDQRSLLFFD